MKVVGTSSCNHLLHVQQVKRHHGYSLSGTSPLSLALSWRQTIRHILTVSHTRAVFPASPSLPASGVLSQQLVVLREDHVTLPIL